jgi:UDP-N-acetyl-D-galactosamine dehydrogenase
MGEYVASQVVKLMIKKEIAIKGSSLLMLGITFKENCPDVRNTKIVDVIKSLNDFGIQVTLFDPIANPAEVKHEYNLITTQTLPIDKFDAIVLGVSHTVFLKMNLSSLRNETSILYDIKGVIRDEVDGKL